MKKMQGRGCLVGALTVQVFLRKATGKVSTILALLYRGGGSVKRLVAVRYPVALGQDAIEGNSDSLFSEYKLSKELVKRYGLTDVNIDIGAVPLL